MMTVLDVGGVSIDVLFKDIKNLHLSVYPPTGRVRISAPRWMSLESVRLFAISKVAWIRRHQGKIQGQSRETPRQYIERESHFVWGKRYLLTVVEGGPKPLVTLGHRAIEMTLPKGTTLTTRANLLDDWYRGELRQRADALIVKWSKRLNVSVDHVYIQRMKTRWGSSKPACLSIRLNLELAKFEPQCLDYVILHEMAHFIVPSHNEKFCAIMDRNMSGWRSVRGRLNEGPLSAFREKN
jgi:predicted metal-dependent hydrolase